MVLFLTSEVLPPLFLAPIQPVNSYSIIFHPTNVVKVKHSRIVFGTFCLSMKGFSSLSGHLGKGRKAACLPQFHFGPNHMISILASIYRKSSFPSFLGKFVGWGSLDSISNHIRDKRIFRVLTDHRDAVFRPCRIGLFAGLPCT
jgi:hypothetical protein